MATVVIASTRADAGKTTLALGLGRALKGKLQYLKPFGDRLLYRKKQLWDYDCALVMSVFDIEQTDMNMPLGFDQSKLRYMYDEKGIKEKIKFMLKEAGEKAKSVLIESGRDFSYGGFVYMDPVSLARTTDSKLVVVLEGHEHKILDDAAFMRNILNLVEVNFAGIVINKIPNMEDFKESLVPEIEALKIPVLGTIPWVEELNYITITSVVNKLLAKVLAGEQSLGSTVRNILVGSMSAQSVVRNPSFQKESILLITSGDRSDMLLAALKADVAGVLLTNSVIPPASIISRFNEAGVPLLLSEKDTYSAATQVHDMDSLLTKEDTKRMSIVENLVSQNVDVDSILA